MTDIERFFFFQAEEGIRDDLVTGVQTCALPISSGGPAAPWSPRFEPSHHLRASAAVTFQVIGDPGWLVPTFTSGSAVRRSRARKSYITRWRSEERRVGKEWRSWREGGWHKERGK